MRKHGWQLPYHPLQVVAIAVFLALGFAFYVFFVPFVGVKVFQYVVMGIYTPLVTCVFCLYIWCAATDPGDLGIFKSKKYLKEEVFEKQEQNKELGQRGLTKEVGTETYVEKQLDGSIASDATRPKSENSTMPCWAIIFYPLKYMCDSCQSKEKPQEQNTSEEGMFYCSLCEVEVLKYSKHCRVCDKCVDGFDHHCRWLNNCIGQKNYKKFFILMASALLLLILQWSVGVLVLVLSLLKHKQYSAEIVSKLGSSFSLTPFIVVVASCTILAMIATLPIAQLFFFHVLLIKKGLSTYDYIVALREQDQEQLVVGEQQSPQMSIVSSVTGLSSTSSFNAFNRGAWCTPPRLFLEDQFDVVPPEIGTSGNPLTKKTITEDVNRKKHAGSVKINPWTLARLNAEEVSRVAAQARKKSKILQPIVRGETNHIQDTDSSMGSASGRMPVRLDNRRRTSKRGKVPDFPLEPLTKISASATDSNGSDLAPDASASLAPLQLEARNAFRPNMPPSFRVVASSPDSSLDSPDLHPFRISSSGAEDMQGLSIPSQPGSGTPKGFQLSRSTSDGYEASGGEDSDRIPSRIVHRSSNWSNVVLSSGRMEMIDVFKGPSSTSMQPHTRPQ